MTEFAHSPEGTEATESPSTPQGANIAERAIKFVAGYEDDGRRPAGGYDYSNAQVINPIVNHGMAPEEVIAALTPTPGNIERARQVNPNWGLAEEEQAQQ